MSLQAKQSAASEILDLALTELSSISVPFASVSELKIANLDMTAEENESRLGSTNYCHSLLNSCHT